MIQGNDVWSRFFTKGMHTKKIGDRDIFTYKDMRKNFYLMLLDTVTENPDKIAFYDHWDRPYSYLEFVGMVDEMSDHLRCTYNVAKGDHVGLLLNTSIEFCVVFYAVCRLGGVVVPLPTKYRQDELNSLVGKANLKLLVLSEEFFGWFEELEFPILYSKSEENGYGFRYLPFMDKISFFEGGDYDDEVILMYTSGTTSESKGVILKNYNIVHAVITYQRLFEIRSEDQTVIPVPIYHVTGLIALLGLFVYAGGTIHLHKRFNARRVLQCVKDNEISFLHVAPTALTMLLDYKDEFQELPSLQTIACGGSYLPVEKIKEIHEWMPETKLRTVYGMTETSSPGTVFPDDAKKSKYPGSSGKPIPGMELKVVGSDMNILEIDEIGKIMVRGANITNYYYNLRSNLISDEGWLETGDLGYINGEGYVFVVDREKDMINRGGEKIWCRDVEEKLLGLKGVKEAAVVGVPDEVYGEAPAAIVVMDKENLLDEQAFKVELAKELAGFKIPQHYLSVSHIPKTKGFKVDKKKIRTMF